MEITIKMMMMTIMLRTSVIVIKDVDKYTIIIFIMILTILISVIAMIIMMILLLIINCNIFSR